MVRIYKKTDKIPVKIDDVTIYISPLSLDQKTEVQHLMVSGRLSNDYKTLTEGISKAIRYTLKGIDGVEDGDGNKYSLEFEDGLLTESCLDDLLNLEIKDRLTMVCISLIKGIPEEFTDQDGKKIDGIELLNKKAPTTKN